MSNVRRGAAVAFALLLSACQAATEAPVVSAGPDGPWLFRAELTIQDAWQHVVLNRATDYRLAARDGKLFIKATGRRSASGLARRVAPDLKACPWLEWTWRVDRMQESADLGNREREDMAASLFLMFGDPGFLSDPEPVPTMRYVWTNKRAGADQVIDSPYMPGVVRSIVVQSGTARMGEWVTERRHLLSDFAAAFGEAPAEGVHVIVLFTDNDQTGEPVEAGYASARLLCQPKDAQRSLRN